MSVVVGHQEVVGSGQATQTVDGAAAHPLRGGASQSGVSGQTGIAAMHGMPVTLPRSAALTETVLVTSRSSISGCELDQIRSGLERRLGRLIGPNIPVALSASGRPGMAGVAYRSLRVGPWSLGPGSGHRESNGAAQLNGGAFRRAIGSAGLTLALQRGCCPAEAVVEVVDRAMGELRADVTSAEPRGSTSSARPGRAGSDSGRFRPWWVLRCAELSQAQMAVVKSEAINWSTALWSVWDWDRFASPPRIGSNPDRWSPRTARRLELYSRSDVRATVGHRVVDLIMSEGFAPTWWERQLGFHALLAGLSRGARAVPARVVGFWPDSGEIRFAEIDSSSLASAAQSILDSIDTMEG